MIFQTFVISLSTRFNFFRLPHWKRNTFHEEVDNITQIVCRTYNCVHAFRHSYESLSLRALKKETIQNVSRVSASENHNFIRARDRNAGCKTGFSIPVSETKIHGSRETAGEVGRCSTTVSRRQAWSDIANPFANIDPVSYMERNGDATRKCTELRATPHSSASRNFEEKTPIKKKHCYRHSPYFS